MKKILFALLVVAFISPLCFAKQPTTQTAKKVAQPVVVKTITGKVDAVMVGDAAKGTKSQITVVDEQGKKLSVVLKSAISITAKDGKNLTVSQIKKDDKINVEYTTSKAGTHKAQSIKLIE